MIKRLLRLLNIAAASENSGVELGPARRRQQKGAIYHGELPQQNPKQETANEQTAQPDSRYEKGTRTGLIADNGYLPRTPIGLSRRSSSDWTAQQSTQLSHLKSSTDLESDGIHPGDSEFVPNVPAKHVLHAGTSLALESPIFGSSPQAARSPWVLPIEPSVSGIAADQATLGDLDVRAVSIIGAAHRCEEPAAPRQDSYRLGRDRAGRYLIIAVADGMSDSRRSDLGATVATRCAVDTLRRYLDGDAEPTGEVMHAVFRTVAGAMVAAADNEKLSGMDIRCALIIAIIPTAPNSRSLRRRAWFTTLADVSAWLRVCDGWEQLAGDQKNHDFDRNTLRFFLPFHPDQAVTVSYDLQPGATVAVVTDGVGDAFTEVPNAARWFAHRWKTPVSVESFLSDVGFHARGQLDDRTSVTVWCRDTARSRQ
jgi:protein phosphatase 2C-like protein